MARPAQFTDDQIVTATMRLVAAKGVADATINNIRNYLGAPTGSIYHRFKSRDLLLGEVWLQAAEAFQRGFALQLTANDTYNTGLAAALLVSERVREYPGEARILLLHRREDFFSNKWPKSMQSRANRLQAELKTGIRNFCRDLTGDCDQKALRICTYALAEAPLAAVKRHVEAGESPPVIVDQLIESTYRASMAIIGIHQ